MKNGNYVLHKETAWAAQDKVIDLTAWRAEHLAEPDRPEAGTARRGRRERARRRRRLADWVELAATLAVTAAFIALAVRVLL